MAGPVRWGSVKREAPGLLMVSFSAWAWVCWIILAAAELRGAKVGHLRLFVHFPPDSVSYEAFHRRKPMVGHIFLHLGGHVAPVALLAHQFDRQIEHPAGHVE